MEGDLSQIMTDASSLQSLTYITNFFLSHSESKRLEIEV